MLTAPPYLVLGDTVAIVAPARKVSVDDISNGIEFLAQKGLKVIEGTNLYNVHHQYAGTDQERVHDLQWAIDHPEVKAIICARGGYGTSRIIDQLNFDSFRARPKWVTGFSDNTTLHCHLHTLGYQSIHSTVPLLMGTEATSLSDNALISALMGKQPNTTFPSNQYAIPGEAHGEVIGGNLTLVVNMLGTASEIDPTDKILFIEDVDEHLYHFDRMMVQLKRAGVLKKLKGLIVGHFSKIKDPVGYFGKTIEEVILDHCAPYNYPVAFGFPAGHEDHNMPLIFGRDASFTVRTNQTTLEYS